MDDRTCPSCGHVNPVAANFCSVCGGVLGPDTDGPAETDHTAQHDVVDHMTGPDPFILVVIRGNNAGSRFAIGAGVTHIGRHPDSDVFLDDVTVSRRHAEVRRTLDGYELADVGSLNGTYLDGERIDRAPLLVSAQVQVGKFKMVVVESDDGS